MFPEKVGSQTVCVRPKAKQHLGRQTRGQRSKEITVVGEKKREAVGEKEGGSMELVPLAS